MNAHPGFDLAPEPPSLSWADVDALAASGDPARAFLRARWFTAGTQPAATLAVLRRSDGTTLAVLPLAKARRGLPFLREVAGGYWPFRGIPGVAPFDGAALSAALDTSASELGPLWRLGPVAANDPTLATLVPAATHAGWTVLRRSLGTLFELDLAALAASGEWPSAKTRRKNRWRLRRLAEDHGAVATHCFTGADWTAQDRDAMAAVEGTSWLGSLPGGGDTKFRDPAQRRFWEELCDDPTLAAMLFGSVMTIGGAPAAFTFGIQARDTRYYIANNFDARFTQFGPGRVLLYEDFERAARLGVRTIGWGVGDAGYKTEMGARPGAALEDLLFVRSALLAALLRHWWERP